MVAAGEDTMIRGWDASSTKDVPVFIISGRTGQVYCLFLHKDSLFSRNSNFSVNQWILLTQKLIRTFTGTLYCITLNLTAGHTHFVDAIVAHGDLLYSAGNDMFIKVWNRTIGSNIFDLTGKYSESEALTRLGHTDIIRSLDLSDDY